MTDRQDNIADDLNDFLDDLVSDVAREPTQPPTQQTPEPVDDELDKYMKKFDEVDVSNKKIAAKVACIHKQADDQQRLYAAIECIKLLQAQLVMSHDLMVEMNNFFGGMREGQ